MRKKSRKSRLDGEKRKSFHVKRFAFSIENRLSFEQFCQSLSVLGLSAQSLSVQGLSAQGLSAQGFSVQGLSVIMFVFYFISACFVLQTVWHLVEAIFAERNARYRKHNNTV